MGRRSRECVLGRSPFGPALEGARLQVRLQVQLTAASYWGRYLTRQSPRPIEREQQLPSEQVLFPFTWRSSHSLAALECAGGFPLTCYLACSLRRASLPTPYIGQAPPVPAGLIPAGTVTECPAS